MLRITWMASGEDVLPPEEIQVSIRIRRVVVFLASCFGGVDVERTAKMITTPIKGIEDFGDSSVVYIWGIYLGL